MSKSFFRKEARSHRHTSPNEDETRSHLRQFLTTIKKHQTPRPKRIVSLSLNLSPSLNNKLESPKIQSRTNNATCSLPMIAKRNKFQRSSGINEFQQHIISNYLNAHLKVSSKKNTISQKSKPKIKRKKKALKMKDRQRTNIDTIQQAQLQTQRGGNRQLQKSAVSRKEYSLKQQPMKHYVKQKMQRKKREWKQVGPLELVTYFYQLGPQTQKQANPFINNKNKQNTMKIKLPSAQNIALFIKAYRPSCKEVNIIDLIHKQSFTVFQDVDFLYFGQSFQGKKHGIGVFVKENYVFQGRWNLNLREKGVEKSTVGTYTGPFVNDKKEGKGEFRWAQGQLYSGQWRNGKKHGVGLWSSPNGDSYMGQWKNGVVEGQGVHRCKNGQKYEGSFKNFLKHGWGRQFFPNKDYYEGPYVEGLPHGKGMYLWQNGTTYQGDFFEGLRHGIGTLKNPKGFSFTGPFVQQFAEGNCQINYGNGDFYVGWLKRGKRNGKGTFKQTLQRKVFDGNWKDDEFATIQEN